MARTMVSLNLGLRVQIAHVVRHFSCIFIPSVLELFWRKSNARSGKCSCWFILPRTVMNFCYLEVTKPNIYIYIYVNDF